MKLNLSTWPLTAMATQRIHHGTAHIIGTLSHTLNGCVILVDITELRHKAEMLQWTICFTGEILYEFSHCGSNAALVAPRINTVSVN